MKAGVGTLVTLKKGMLGNMAGTVGVGFNAYDGGVQFIFENGNYDGFSHDEIRLYLEVLEANPPLALIQQIPPFTSVINTSRQWQGGVFNRYFDRAKSLLVRPHGR